MNNIILPQYGGSFSFRVPNLQPFSWSNHNRISFIEMQQANAQQQAKEPTGPLKDIIEYQAQDSITFDIQEKNFNIYGAGTIGYEDAQLTAENISLNWANNTIIATGKKNEEGKIDPKPVFQQGNTKYIAEEIRYNFESKRGTARRLFTKLEEIIIRARKAKMDVEDTYYTDRIKLTSCNLTNPHYFVKARDVKFVKGKRVASGPFQLYFDGVPTILGFFYGLFYLPTPKASGIIRPQIGENGEKGFFLKEGGYYFYFNDYVDLALRGSLYSKGDAAFMANSRYKKRYGYNGSLEYTREITSRTAETALQEDKDKEWRFKWQHRTDNSRVSSLTAEVDIQSKSPRNSSQTRGEPENISAKTQSKIRYNRKFLGTPYSLNTSVAHSKDFKNNLTNITFPELVLNTTPIYIFRRKNSTPKYWYDDINFKHTSEFKYDLNNTIDNKNLEFSRENWPKFLKESRCGVKHSFPIVTNIKLFNYFNLNPSFEYIERWYFKQLAYRVVQDSVTTDTNKGFYRVWDYKAGADLQTTIYGTHFFSEEASVQAIRHRIEPSVGLTYSPGFSPYWQKIQSKNGEEFKDKFAGEAYGTPKHKASALLTMKVDNTVEIKVRDTNNTAAKPKKVPIFESLNMSTTYDFLADSFKLGDINLGARTRLLDSLISLEYSATFDPYTYIEKKRVEEFAWQHGKGLGTMKKYEFKASTTLKSKYQQNEDSSKKESLKKDALDELEPKQQISSLDSTQYVNFDTPWQLSLAYSQIYTYNIEKDSKDTTRQLQFKGEVGITQNWKIAFDTIYDFGKQELVGSATSLKVFRDLHCWQMSFDWKPLASRQSYEFSIGLKAPMLQDLKFPHNREYDKL
ncbi:MAG: putative LPS assembly protein LptD [Candidatus Amoebophilus sp.]